MKKKHSTKETSVLLFLCIGYVFGAPQDSTTEPIPILSQESNIEPDGSYQYKWVKLIYASVCACACVSHLSIAFEVTKTLKLP